jgi:hypothetical protein
MTAVATYSYTAVMSESAAGWSIERRRREIHRVLQLLVDQGMDRAGAIDLLARRFLVGFNTVEGWVSEGGAGTRAPPDWKVLEILRYELGLIPVRRIMDWAKTRKSAASRGPVKLRLAGKR